MSILCCVKTPFTKDVKSFAQILCHDVVWVGTINKQISHPFPLSSDRPSFLKVFYLRDYTHHKKEPTNNPQCQICFHALKGKKCWDWMGLGWMVIIGHWSSKSTSEEPINNRQHQIRLHRKSNSNTGGMVISLGRHFLPS